MCVQYDKQLDHAKSHRITRLPYNITSEMK